MEKTLAVRTVPFQDSQSPAVPRRQMASIKVLSWLPRRGLNNNDANDLAKQ